MLDFALCIDCGAGERIMEAVLDARECLGDIEPFMAAGPVGGMTGLGVPFMATVGSAGAGAFKVC